MFNLFKKSSKNTCEHVWSNWKIVSKDIRKSFNRNTIWIDENFYYQGYIKLSRICLSCGQIDNKEYYTNSKEYYTNSNENAIKVESELNALENLLKETLIKD